MVVLGSALLARAAPGAGGEPLDELVFPSGPPMAYGGGKAGYDLDLRLSAVKKDMAGTWTAWGVEANLRRYKAGGVTVMGNSVAFPPLEYNALFPVAGRLYKVRHMSGVGRGGVAEGHSMTAQVVPPADWPDGVSLGMRTTVVPYTPGDLGGTGVREGWIYFRGVDPPVDGKGDAVVRLQVRDETESLRVIRMAAVKAGDVVLVGGKGFKVLSVTSPKPKTGVIGWVELDPDGIPEKELVEKKVPFVRPEPVKGEKK